MLSLSSLYVRCPGLEQTEEYVNGQLKNKYGDAFIRGNNVLYISTTSPPRRGGSCSWRRGISFVFWSK